MSQFWQNKVYRPFFNLGFTSILNLIRDIGWFVRKRVQLDAFFNSLRVSFY